MISMILLSGQNVLEIQQCLVVTDRVSAGEGRCRSQRSSAARGHYPRMQVKQQETHRIVSFGFS